MAVLRLFFCLSLLNFAYFQPSLAEQNQNSSPNKRRIRLKTYEDDGSFLFVLDDLLPPSILQAYYGIASMSDIHGKVSPWQYAYKDYYFGYQMANSSTNVPWISPVDPSFFVTTTLWDQMKKATEKLSGKEYFPRDVYVSMLHRLDFATVDDSATDDNTEMVARILLAPRVKKNDYGESVFYKKNGEILAAVFPKFGRLLLWNVSMPYTYKPPAMSYVQGLYCLTVRMSTAKEKMDHGSAKTKEQFSTSKMREEMDFPLSDDKPLEDKNPADHLTRKIHNSQGKVIAYFDGLISKDDLDAMRLFLLQYNSAFGYQGYDETSDTEHDNVSWITAIKVAKFVKSRIWKEIRRAVEFLSGKEGWYPYDVAMNIIRNSHYTRIHEDCEEHEDEYTILLYLTPDWKAEYCGETTFFEERMQANGQPYPIGHRQYDWLASVRPRYGRIVIFRGIIPHSARPPSAGFQSARYTFACKVSKTYRIAHAKMLRETIENVEPGDPDFKLLEDLSEGLYDQPSKDKPIEFLEKELAKRKQQRRDRMSEVKQGFVQSVMS